MGEQRKGQLPFTVIWVDYETAKIYHFSEELMQRETLKWEKLESVVCLLINAARILVLGPGVIKHELAELLSKHYPELSRRVVGCEESETPTDEKIAQYVLKFVA